MDDLDQVLASEIKTFRMRLLGLRAQALRQVEALNVAIENTELKLERAESLLARNKTELAALEKEEE